MIGTGAGEKSTINGPLNVDNYYGKHTGRVFPLVSFLLVASIPFLVYASMLQGLVPFIPVLIFELLWAGRWALIILGEEKKKLRQYKGEKEDEYAAINKMMRVSHVYEDGLIEYSNGRVAYLLSGFLHTYFNDDALSEDLGDLFDVLGKYEFDIYCHEVVGEYKLQNNLRGVSKYKDKIMMKERMDFLIYQDTYNDDHSSLYQVNILIKAGKYDWKKLKETLGEVLESNVSNVFFKKWVCNREQAYDVMSRDICGYIDPQKMLEDKYKNEEYKGSEVLFYGDEIPEEYRARKDHVSLERRRIKE